MPKCSRTHQKAEQRDSRHAVLSKPYKPVLCAATLAGIVFPIVMLAGLALCRRLVRGKEVVEG